MVKNSLEIKSKAESKKKEQPARPAYFLSISLENVRCFGPRQTLDLSDGKGRPSQWTILLGDNGVGKTSILQSISLILPVKVPYLKDFFEQSETSNAELRSKLSKSLYPRFLDSSGHGLNHLRRNHNFFLLSGQVFKGAQLTEQNNNGSIDECYIKIEKGKALTFSQSDEEQLGRFTCFGYGASRRMGETSLSEKFDDDAFASLFSEDVALLNAEEWLLQADYAASKFSRVRARFVKRRDKIKDVLIRLLPDVDDIKVVQLTEDQPKPSIEVKTPYGWVGIKDLSLGYKTLIAWMGDLASRMFDRYPNSPNPLAEPAVVLVDEIDLHLHPKWQRNLMGFLSDLFPNTQFIATAHSPLVAQAATNANIVLLRREGDHVVIDNDVKAIHNWRVDQILTSDLFGLESARPPQLDDLLEERTKILSKGRLTKKDRKRLEEVEAQIGSLPTGETPEEMEAMDVIRRAAKRLKAEGI